MFAVDLVQADCAFSTLREWIGLAGKPRKDGSVKISGKDISFKASGKYSVKASKDIVLKGKKIAEN